MTHAEPAPNRATIARLARLLFWPALAFALVMAVWPQAPKLPLGDNADKWTHVMAFAVLAALALAGYPRTSRWRILFALAGCGALIELIQTIPALNREADLADWLADTAAVAVVMGVERVLRWGWGT